MVRSSTPDIDLRISELATAQHGVVTLGQLVALGLSRSTIGRWLASGRLCRLHPGVYCVGHGSPSRQGRMLAALFACGESSAIARRTALEVWKVWRSTERAIDVVVVGRTRDRDGVDIHHSRLLPDGHVRSNGVLRVTTPARTLMDLALELDAQQLANVIHEMRFRRVYSRADFARCIRRMQASVATPVALAALEIDRVGGAGTKSELEQRVRALLLEFGVQLPESNVVVSTELGWIELDNAWRDAMIYLEVDGPPHARRRTQNRDRDRRIALQRAGWTELRIGYLELDLDRIGAGRRLARVLPSAQ